MHKSVQKQPTVLIVDDEDDILDLLAYNFEQANMATLRAHNGVEALQQARDNDIDLIILDVMMPQMDGLETCRRVRRHPRLRQIPILILTARSSEKDHIAGLDVGADSFLPKSASIGVIISQVRALIRGMQRKDPVSNTNTLSILDLEIDRDRYLVFRKNQGKRIELRFPRKEFELLYFLANSPGLVFSRQDLLNHIWGPDVYVVDRTVDVHVRKIREKLGKKYIETVMGVGYRFKEPA